MIKIKSDKTLVNELPDVFEDELEESSSGQQSPGATMKRQRHDSGYVPDIVRKPGKKKSIDTIMTRLRNQFKFMFELRNNLTKSSFCFGKHKRLFKWSGSILYFTFTVIEGQNHAV